MDKVFNFIFTGNFKLWLPSISYRLLLFKNKYYCKYLAACLIFIKYHIYNFSDCISKIFFKVLIYYLNLYQCFLIGIHFFLVCKLVQYFHSPSHNLLLHFSPRLCLAYLEKVYYLVYQKEETKQKIVPCFFLTPFWGNLTLTLIFNMCIKDFDYFVINF